MSFLVFFCMNHGWLVINFFPNLTFIEGWRRGGPRKLSFSAALNQTSLRRGDRQFSRLTARAHVSFSKSKFHQISSHAPNSLAKCLVFFFLIKIFCRSSSPEPKDFENENAQCSWDHSMDKNGVHTLQVDQKSSELGISGSFDSLDLESSSNSRFQKY